MATTVTSPATSSFGATLRCVNTDSKHSRTPACRKASTPQPMAPNSFSHTAFLSSKLTQKTQSPMVQRGGSIISASASAVVVGGDTELVNVGVSGRTYPIYIGGGILDDTEIYKRHIKGNQVLIVTNTRVSSLYVDGLVAALMRIRNLKVEAIGLPDGEEHKKKESVFKIIDEAVQAKMNSTTTFIGLGGGVINDLCAFSAAVYEGGVNYIQIPTTLTAQVDASVANETGIYHLLDKQSMCSYYEPECVIVDRNLLRTLPGKELISGIAEIIKFALVRDGAFLQWLKDNMDKLLDRDQHVLTHAIKRSCEIKSEILSIDRRQGGIKDILSLGQPCANGILKSMEQGEWLHGEALAVGMVMMLDLSHRLGWIDDSLLIDAIVAMERAHLPTAPPAHISKDTLKRNMDLPSDRNPMLALLKGPAGNSVFTNDYDPIALESMLTFFCLGDRV